MKSEYSISIKDIQIVTDEKVKEMTDEELLYQDFFFVENWTNYAIEKKSFEFNKDNISKEVYNRGLFNAREYLRKRLIKEDFSGNRLREGVNNHAEYYIKRYRN